MGRKRSSSDMTIKEGRKKIDSSNKKTQPAVRGVSTTAKPAAKRRNTGPKGTMTKKTSDAEVPMETSSDPGQVSSLTAGPAGLLVQPGQVSSISFDDDINILGGSQPLGLMSITAPLGGHVSTAMRQKIVNGEFVDLGALLFGRETEPTQGFTFNASGALIAIPQRTRQIFTIDQWTDAFITFTAIFVTQHPHRAPELLKYMNIIREAAHKFAGPGWRQYDIEFRRRHAATPTASWALIDGELWCTILMSYGSQRAVGFSRGGPETYSGVRPMYAQQGRPRDAAVATNALIHPARGSAFNSNRVCYAFNRREGCKWGANCRWPHVCAGCRSPSHAAYICTGKQQS